MNAQQFFQYIEHPDKLGIHEEVQLRGVLKEFPYFQSAHILLAKCLKNMDNYTFEKQLRMAAVFSSNRAVMYHLLKSAQRNEPAVTVPHQVVSETPEAKPAQLIPQPIDKTDMEKPVQPILQSVLESLDQEDDVVFPEPEPAPIIEVKSEAPVQIIEPIVEPVKPVASPIKSEESDHLEQRRIEIARQYEAFLQRKAALSGVPIKTEAAPEARPVPAIEPEQETQSKIEPMTALPEVETEKVTEEPVASVSETAQSEPVNIEAMTSLPEVEAEKVMEAPEASVPEATLPEPINFETEEVENSEVTIIEKPVSQVASGETHSFSEWLNLATGQGVHKEPITAVTATEPEMDEEDIAPEEEVSAPVSKVSKDEIDAILERFIHQNPSISRPKSEFFNPVKAAQKSLEDSGDLVTETLARMHEKQGNYQKAINIYEKLSLKFPEKASIFAALITELKHKIN